MNFLSFLLFSGLILGCYSAIFLERQPVVPGREKQCYDKAEDVFYEKGEEMKWKAKGCARKICGGSTGRGYTYAEIQTCGKVSVPPECRVEVDSDLSYPFCCERVLCPEKHDPDNTGNTPRPLH